MGTLILIIVGLLIVLFLLPRIIGFLFRLVIAALLVSIALMVVLWLIHHGPF